MQIVNVLKLALVALISVTTSGAPEATAENVRNTRDGGFGRATFYQLPNYQGRSFVVYGTGNISNLRKKSRGSGNWNNEISSVYIEGDITITLFEDLKFNGPRTTLTQSISDLQRLNTTINWNNAVSSISYKPRTASPVSTQIMFYENPYYSGRSFVLRAGEGISNLKDKQRGNIFHDWNDEIESIFFDGIASVVLYEHKDYRGTSITLKSSESDLALRGWKKKASSLLIIPATK